MKKLFIITFLLLIMFCSKNYYPVSYVTIQDTSYITVPDTTRNAFGIKNPVIVILKYPFLTYGIGVYGNGQPIFIHTIGFSDTLSDTLVVPDSCNLFAIWNYNQADTIAFNGLIWNIGY